MAKHRKELLSKECATMESGFETDPQMTVIYMPDNGQENEADGGAQITEKADEQADASSLQGRDRSGSADEGHGTHNGVGRQ
jgi:hypothetical protein